MAMAQQNKHQVRFMGQEQPFNNISLQCPQVESHFSQPYFSALYKRRCSAAIGMGISSCHGLNIGPTNSGVHAALHIGR